MRSLSHLRPNVLLAFAALSIVAACDNSDGPDSVARVRFLHASQGRAAIDFRADGTTRGAGVTYGGTWSNSVVLDAGARTFTARLTGGATDLATTAKTLANSANYSVVLAKRAAGDSLVVFADTSATPATDKSWVRVLNVSPAAGAVDVYVTAANADLATATPQATAIDFLKPSKYVEVTSGAQRVRLTTAGTKTVVLDINTIALPSRGVRSLAILDANAGGAPLQSVTASERN
jgi:hypothetical protein